MDPSKTTQSVQYSIFSKNILLKQFSEKIEKVGENSTTDTLEDLSGHRSELQRIIEDKKRTELAATIQKLQHTSSEFIDLDLPKSGFKGSLIIYECPQLPPNHPRTTPPEYSDLSIRLRKMIKTSDILIFDAPSTAEFVLRNEDRRLEHHPAQKVFSTGLQFLQESHPLDILDQKREVAERFLSREDFEAAEFERVAYQYESVLGELETFKQYKEAKRRKNHYDSKPFFDPESGVFGVDDKFVEQVKDKVYELRIKWGTGLLLQMPNFVDFGEFGEDGGSGRDEILDKLLQCMRAGMKVGVVSQASSPLQNAHFSSFDENLRFLVEKCMERNLVIESIPGVCKLTVALSSSGIPSDRFDFVARLSENPVLRKNELVGMRDARKTTIIGIRNRVGSNEVGGASERSGFIGKTDLFDILSSGVEVFGKRQIAFLGINIGKGGGLERKVRGEIGDLIQILREDQNYNIDDLDENDDILLIISPYGHLFNKGEQNPSVIHSFILLDDFPPSNSSFSKPKKIPLFL